MIFSSLLLAVAALSNATILRMGPMTGSVKIDNEITFDEQFAVSTQYGGISDRNGLMSNRYVVYHVGYNDEGLYYGVRSSIPEHPLVLSDNDTVNIALLPPGADKPYVFTRKVKDGRMLPGIIHYGVLCAENEMFIPYSKLGGRKPAAGEKWGLQMWVDFTNPKERSSWAWEKGNEAALGTLIFDPQAPIVSIANFYTLEMWRASANVRMLFRINNTNGAAFTTDHRTMIHAGVGDSKLDSHAELDAHVQHREFDQLRQAKIPAGKIESIVPMLYNLWSGTVNIFEIDIGNGERTLLKRKIRWDLAKGVDWTDEEGLPNVRIAYFPSCGDRLRMNYRIGKMTDLVHGELKVVGAKNGPVWERKFDGKKYLKNDIVDITLKDLAEDEYRVEFTAYNAAGRKFFDYDEFDKKTFPWQTAAAGKDRIIVAPYKPIKVEGDKVSFLLTAYNQKGLLWDKVFAKGENILAAPIELKLNGETFKVTGVKTVEQVDDVVTRELEAVSLAHPKLTVKAIQTYEYDGFCRMQFFFNAVEPVEVKSLQLFIPIKDKIVKYFNVLARNDKRAGPAPDFTFPQGEGEVWNSATDRTWNPKIYPAPIQNYIWLGGVEKGFTWMVQSWENWSLKRGCPAERAIRKDGAVTLICDFVNEPVTWSGKKKIEMFFEPTPLRPRDVKQLKFADYMYSQRWPTNSIRYAMNACQTMQFPMLAPANTYPNGDKSMWNWVKNSTQLGTKAYWKRADEFMAKNRDWYERQYTTSVADFYSDRNKPRAMATDISLVYWNPRLITVFWPEWRMYRSEWYVEPFSPLNYFNEYMGDVVPSRVDKLMYDAKQSLDDGADGLYYDCYSNMGGWSLADGYAWTDPNGGVDDWGATKQKLGCLIGWREIMKRSAVLCQQYGKTYNGRPITELHDTEGNIVMVNAFSLTGLSTERSSNGGDFQDRFPESFTIVNILGGLTGKGSRIIVSAKVGDTARREQELKSLMGYMCAYGFFSMNDQNILVRDWFEKAWNIPFDFGLGEDRVEHFFYYDEDVKQPYLHTGKDVRMNILRHRDGSGDLILVGNLGKETEFAFEPTDGVKRVYTDAETSASVDPAHVKLDYHGYRMIFAK